MTMFCYQCEQTAKGSGCTIAGVCGKDETTAKLQDLLVQVTKEIAVAVDIAGRKGIRDESVDEFILEALFTTVTNVNFDPDMIIEMICKAKKIRNCIAALASTTKDPTLAACSVRLSSDACETKEQMLKQAERYGIERHREEFGNTVAGLQDMILYGLKGAAAYAHHAWVLGKKEGALCAEFARTLAILSENPTDIDQLLSEALQVGKINIQAMTLLDAANTENYGKPEPTLVRVTPVQGKCILVSGHDLKDLFMLLQQTHGKGINVYTHGEMLPTLAYPAMKAFSHLVGNYGGAWQDQAKEFAEFPGAILMTTNCIQRPRDSYIKNIFTTGLVEFPGVSHIPAKEDGSKDFTPVINAALALPGFAESVVPEKRITVGFAADAVLGVAGPVIEAVKAGKIRRFFLIGGCDGAKPGRNYYTDFARQVPNDCVILTLACGKFRFNKLDFGNIGGIPRLLDVGQCNDAISAVRIATALADAFQCSVNDLPLSMVLSWYEQKAVAILLSLLSLNIKGIRLGPSLPAFATPEVLEVLVSQFGIKPITTPEEDLKAIMG
ncbi:MAG: hydroxylamine reductase [Planctomycetaceae bacterium]|nr:hydroxylamine reductase [Planctomycetaceae bacterium]